MTKQAGFSLIEIMLTFSLLAVVIAVTSWFWHDIQHTYIFGSNQYTVTEKASQTVRQVANELRQAQEAMNGAYPLAVLEDNQLTYFADTNSDGLVERVRYFINDDKLMRGIIIPSGNPPAYIETEERIRIMVDQIDLNQLPLFTYYNGSWPGDTVNNPLGYWQRPLETRLIKITIPIVMTSTNGEQRYTTNELVQIRNLKNNL